MLSDFVVSNSKGLQQTFQVLTLDIYGMSLNLEFLYASSPLIKLSSKGAFATGVFII